MKHGHVIKQASHYKDTDCLFFRCVGWKWRCIGIHQLQFSHGGNRYIWSFIFLNFNVQEYFSLHKKKKEYQHYLGLRDGIYRSFETLMRRKSRPRNQAGSFTAFYSMKEAVRTVDLLLPSKAKRHKTQLASDSLIFIPDFAHA